jgi:hypothetical protein
MNSPDERWYSEEAVPDGTDRGLAAAGRSAGGEGATEASVQDFERWLGSTTRSPAEMILKNRLRE